MVVVFVGCQVETDVASGQARFHLQHFALGDIEVGRHRAHFGGVEPAQARLRLAQVEEQLALRLGRGDLDDAPVLQDELVHLGTDPVHGETHQAHADVGVEALDGLHQADVAFLDQVAERQAVAVVAAGDVHDETQVREHQFARGIEVVVVAEAAGQRLFLLDRQHRDLMHGTDVRLERTQGAGDGQVVGNQGIRHGGIGHGGDFSNGIL
jgi:hypothetical protein